MGRRSTESADFGRTLQQIRRSEIHSVVSVVHVNALLYTNTLKEFTGKVKKGYLNSIPAVPIPGV